MARLGNNPNEVLESLERIRLDLEMRKAAHVSNGPFRHVPSKKDGHRFKVVNGLGKLVKRGSLSSCRKYAEQKNDAYLKHLMLKP